ncbi:TIGR02611 family protein [Cryobacterium sp. TMT1-21]|uniref:TIGR02611 family protein n=1 Tax=Cryobacterium shii TaxID=1259235 RepID=A0AAQ2C4K6_9MICO|nr:MULTISPECIES: PGPGW domain-containing protein [Cryobacterium]TFC43149.1 TIGR02611 family protein [Cryobacterium shii]TFC86212.1 TIGR02611 family protein [Cryobacterium sp. TmT2-59]TFD12654.1 TIGR02611 family protein [Cryobacterium sp. TMT1-21]TFD17381.1 TIGR02611 family protein [Cryobacterium sp. TMT4-10]TFD20794.1 TIGR02611 family protein [Cryobacterium sp. TMT2-23]
MSDTLQREIDQGSGSHHPIRRLLRRCRAWVERYPRIRWLYRLAVGLLGAFVVTLGLLLVPLPGPGWLVVFLGIAILGTEFPAAHRVGVLLRRILTSVWGWWKTRRAAARARRADRSPRAYGIESA